MLCVWVRLVLGMLGGELKDALPTWPWPGEVLLPTGCFSLCWRPGAKCLLPEHRGWGITSSMMAFLMVRTASSDGMKRAF